MNDDAKEDVPGVAVVPARSRRKLELEAVRDARQLVLRVVLAIVEARRRVVGDADVCVSRCRTVIPRQLAGASGKNLVIGSVSASFPASTCSITAVAVNILPNEPD